MPAARLLPALLILFACTAWVVWHSLEPRVDPTPDIARDKQLPAWIAADLELVDPGSLIAEARHDLPRVFWEGLRQLDLRIIDGDLAKAALIRERLGLTAELAASRTNRKGFAELVGAHADVLDSATERVVLDPDKGRATRRLTAIMALESYWTGQGRPAEALPGVDPRNYQTIEMAWALRHVTELLRENRKPDVETVRMAASMLKLSEPEPSALVRAERGFLMMECWLAGIADGDQGVGPVQALDHAGWALAGQAPQRNELLSLILRVTPLVPKEGAIWRKTAVEYVLDLGEEVPPRLWRLAMGLAPTVGRADLRDRSLKLHRDNPESALHGAALHVEALGMVDRGEDRSAIFSVFDRALKVVMDSQERADLMVDIGVFERECSKSIKDDHRRFMQRALTRFREAVKLDESHVAARLNLAQVAIKAQDLESTVKWLEGIDDRRMTRRQTAIGHSVWANVHIARSQWSAARTRMEQAEKLVPDLPGLELIRRALDNRPQ